MTHLENAVRDAYTQAHNWFDVKDVAYGAKGDGSTDDTAAIQAAITAAEASGGVVYFPVGNYICSSTLNVTGTITIKGAGAGSADHLLSALTRLTFATTSTDGLNISAGGCTLEDLVVINTSGAETAGAGIHVTQGSYMHLSRVGIRGFYDNLAIDVGIYYTIEASYLLNCVRYAAHIQNTSVADAGDGFIGSGTVIWPRSTGSTSAIRWESGGGLKVEGIKVNSNTGGFAKGIDAAIADGATTSVFVVDGNSVEGCTTTAISVTQQGTTGVFGKVIITANEIGPAGTTPTGIAVVSTTVGDITDVVIADNYVSATTNGIQIDGAYPVTIGNNEVTGSMSDSGISIRNVAGGTISPNTITGQWTNAAINIKSSGTPSSSLSIDHQNVISSAGSQSTILDSSASVSSSLKRNRIVYDETREIAGVSTTYVNMYEFVVPASVGAGGVLEFGVEGVVTGGSPTGDAFAIYGKRLVTVTIGNVLTLTTIGTDVTAGTTFDYTLDTATANTIKLQIRINPTQAGTAVHGQVHAKYDGPLQRLIRI